MSSIKFEATNPEKEKILENCAKIHQASECAEILSTTSGDAKSYYCDRGELKLFESEMFDYDFSTPIELRTILQKMWEYQGHVYMKEFAVIAAIAAFRNKAESVAPTQTNIPAFIYNF